MNSIPKVQPGYKFLSWLLFCSMWMSPILNAQDTNSVYTQPRLQNFLQMVPPDQSVSYPFWVDQTTSCSIAVSSIAKNLGIQLKDPNGHLFLFGQSDSAYFQSSLSPDPVAYPDAPGINYYINLGTPAVGKWTMQIMAPTVPDLVLTLPVQIVFNNQVGPVLFGGGGVTSIGSAVSFSLAVVDGTGKVGNPQISATLFRLDDSSVPPAPVSFLDDGQGADYVAGDSIYSVYLTPSQAGSYMLQIDVSGDASTGHFQRSIASGFKIVPRTARIVGTFKERVIPAIPR